MNNTVLRHYRKYMIFVGTLGQLIYFFQAYEIMLLKNSAGVSFWGFFIAFVSTTSWAVYGFLLGDRVLKLANTIGVIGSLWCLFMIKIYA